MDDKPSHTAVVGGDGFNTWPAGAVVAFLFVGDEVADGEDVHGAGHWHPQECAEAGAPASSGGEGEHGLG